MIVSCDYEQNKNIVAMSLANHMLKSMLCPVFLCVGTNKVVVDAVGAITGELLKEKYNIKAPVFGCLNKNVDANNLNETIKHIKNNYPNAPIVLIDGILGDLNELGHVKFYEKGAFASGVFNKGVYVGDYSILAVVDVKGVDALSLIKSEKIKLVSKVSNFIAESVYKAFSFCGKLV